MAKHPNRTWGIVALIAAITGFLAGILTAPKSGKETREDIKETANRVVSEAEKKLKVLHSEMNIVLMDAKELMQGKTGKTKDDLSRAYDKAKQTQGKVKVLLTTLRDGGASDDPELSQAIKDAKEAVSHLKKYMK
jgi:gas vesicle protein